MWWQLTSVTSMRCFLRNFSFWFNWKFSRFFLELELRRILRSFKCLKVIQNQYYWNKNNNKSLAMSIPALIQVEFWQGNEFQENLAWVNATNFNYSLMPFEVFHIKIFILYISKVSIERKSLRVKLKSWTFSNRFAESATVPVSMQLFLWKISNNPRHCKRNRLEPFAVFRSDGAKTKAKRSRRD